MRLRDFFWAAALFLPLFGKLCWLDGRSRSPKHTLGASPSHLPISIGAHNMNDLQRSNPQTNFKAALLSQNRKRRFDSLFARCTAKFSPDTDKTCNRSSFANYTLKCTFLSRRLREPRGWRQEAGFVQPALLSVFSR